MYNSQFYFMHKISLMSIINCPDVCISTYPRYILLPFDMKFGMMIDYRKGKFLTFNCSTYQ